MVLTSSGDPFKSRAFPLGGHRGRTQRDAPAGLEESTLLCCELPVREHLQTLDSGPLAMAREKARILVLQPQRPEVGQQPE